MSGSKRGGGGTEWQSGKKCKISGCREIHVGNWAGVAVFVTERSCLYKKNIVDKSNCLVKNCVSLLIGRFRTKEQEHTKVICESEVVEQGRVFNKHWTQSMLKDVQLRREEKFILHIQLGWENVL